MILKFNEMYSPKATHLLVYHDSEQDKSEVATYVRDIFRKMSVTLTQRYVF